MRKQFRCYVSATMEFIYFLTKAVDNTLLTFFLSYILVTLGLNLCHTHDRQVLY